MSDSRFRMYLLVPFILVLVLGSAWASNGDVPPEFFLGGIKSGLERSPDQYVAALIEVVTPPDCDDPSLERTWKLLITIIKLFAVKGSEVREGDSIQSFGNGAVGSRYLAFVVPIDVGTVVYSGTLMSGRTDESTQRKFADAIRKSGLEASSNNRSQQPTR